MNKFSHYFYAKYKIGKKVFAVSVTRIYSHISENFLANLINIFAIFKGAPHSISNTILVCDMESCDKNISKIRNVTLTFKNIRIRKKN